MFHSPGTSYPRSSTQRKGTLKNTSLVHPSRRVKLNGPVYFKSDKTIDVQDKNLSADEIETNIEDSVISDGDR